MSQNVQVFVYGTLKQGEPNHCWFSKRKEGFYKFLYNAETLQKFPLIIATKYNVPFLLFSPGKGHHVMGEVYEVDSKVLADLDELEEHPTFYVREKHHIRRTNDTSETEAWIYFITRFRPELLSYSMYANYSNNDAHGLKYIPSDDKSSIDDLL